MHLDAPPSEPRPEGFEPWELDAVNAVVASFLAARGSLRSHAFADLVQEGLLVWWEKRNEFSPNRGSTPRTFLSSVVTNRLLDLLREELAEKRTGDRTALSLDQPAEDDLPMAALIPDQDQALDPVRAAEIADLAAVLGRARQRLSPRERALFDGLLGEKTMSELSHELRTSRVTLYKDRERIRQALEKEGLAEYLPDAT